MTLEIGAIGLLLPPPREAGAGLRGGISVTLTLPLPAGPERSTVLTMIYGINVLLILGHGPAIGQVIRRAVTAGA